MSEQEIALHMINVRNQVIVSRHKRGYRLSTKPLREMGILNLQELVVAHYADDYKLPTEVVEEEYDHFRQMIAALYGDYISHGGFWPIMREVGDCPLQNYQCVMTGDPILWAYQWGGYSPFRDATGKQMPWVVLWRFVWQIFWKQPDYDRGKCNPLLLTSHMHALRTMVGLCVQDADAPGLRALMSESFLRPFSGKSYIGETTEFRLPSIPLTRYIYESIGAGL